MMTRLVAKHLTDKSYQFVKQWFGNLTAGPQVLALTLDLYAGATHMDENVDIICGRKFRHTDAVLNHCVMGRYLELEEQPINLIGSAQLGAHSLKLNSRAQLD